MEVTDGISVLVPTRNRPASVIRLCESAYATATDRGQLQFVFYVDDDDRLSRDACERYGDVIVGPRVVLSEMWNECVARARHDVFMHCGDDIVFRSEWWDTSVQREFDASPDKLILVHGRDGYQDARIATHGFYHRNWVDALGYLVPPYFSSDYNDLWNTEVADAVGRRVYLDQVYTEHLHPSAGKAELDQTHRERLERHRRDDVDDLYRRLEPRRAEDVAKLRAAIADGRYTR